MQRKYQQSKKFNWRRFLSLLLLFSCIILTFSGVVLWVFPRGGVAYRLNYYLLGCNKEQWKTLHASVSLLFVSASVCHLIFHRKTLWKYLTSVANRTGRITFEFWGALLLVLFLLIGSVTFIPPLSAIKKMSNDVKSSCVESTGNQGGRHLGPKQLRKGKNRRCGRGGSYDGHTDFFLQKKLKKE